MLFIKAPLRKGSHVGIVLILPERLGKDDALTQLALGTYWRLGVKLGRFTGTASSIITDSATNPLRKKSPWNRFAHGIGSLKRSIFPVADAAL